MLSASGESGAVKHGYQTAAVLGRWTVTVAESRRRFSLRAQAQSVSPYWIGERPLTLELKVGTDTWVWDGVVPAVSGPEVTVTLEVPPRVVRYGSVAMRRQ